MKRYVVAVCVLVSVGIALRGCPRRPGNSGLTQPYTMGKGEGDHRAIPAVILNPQDTEALRVDMVNHTITIATPGGQKTEYVRDPIVHIQKDGTVVVQANKWGRELSPCFGVGYGDGPRVYVGVSLFYVWRFDANVHVGISLTRGHRDVDTLCSISYNFWRGSNIFVGVDPVASVVRQAPAYHVGAFVRF